LGGGIAHVQDDFPGAIVLELPDAGVLAAFDDGLAVFVCGTELEGAVGVAEIAGGGDIGANGSPGKMIVFVVEEAHRFGDVGLSLDGRCAVGELDGVVGVVRHVSLRALFGCGFHEIGFELFQGVRGGFGGCGNSWVGAGEEERCEENGDDESEQERFHVASEECVGIPGS